MSDQPTTTRRKLLRTAVAAGAAGVSLTSIGTTAADRVARRDFGRVWANDTLY
ncbi:MAG: hypothetical protein ABEJ35_07905 [Halobacteriaceae archaeon]